ncbi:MAG: ornithine cyclodeaminase family protein [Prochloraceae cyanobacterium]
MSIRILSAQDVEMALSMNKAIDLMRVVFSQLAADRVTLPLRGQIATKSGITLLMPAYLHQSEDLAVKLVSVYKNNHQLKIPNVNAIVLVLDSQTGIPKALIEGNALTAIRTGAVGGLAAQLLSRHDSEIVGLFGAGVQAKAQLLGAMAVRSIKKVNLISQTPSSAQKLANIIKSWSNPPQVNLVATPQQAVQNADIVITATNSLTPVFNGQDLKLGTHITAVGSYQPHMQEIDSITLKRARIIVDSKEACLAEAGDIIISKAHIDAELGEIINQTKSARQSEAEITFFKSVGLAIQDVITGNWILKEAEKQKLGKVIDL